MKALTFAESGALSVIDSATKSLMTPTVLLPASVTGDATATRGTRSRYRDGIENPVGPLPLIVNLGKIPLGIAQIAGHLGEAGPGILELVQTLGRTTHLIGMVVQESARAEANALLEAIHRPRDRIHRSLPFSFLTIV